MSLITGLNGAAFLALSLFASSSLLAIELPSQANMVREFQLRWKDTPSHFFEEREKNANLNSCRIDLHQALSSYLKYARMEKPDFKKMDAMLSGNRSLVELLDKCGPCVARVDKKNGTVYDSFVWCHINKTPAQDRSFKLESVVNYLLSLKNYETHFNYIINFKGVDVEDGIPTLVESPQFNPVQAETFNAFIAVRASFPGLTHFGLGYFGLCTQRFIKDEAAPYFNLRFKNVDLPKSSFPNNVEDTYKGQIAYDLKPISSVSGGWFADLENISYYTVADFSSVDFGFPSIDLDPSQFFQKMESMSTYAKRVIMDTGLTLLHKHYPLEVD